MATRQLYHEAANTERTGAAHRRGTINVMEAPNLLPTQFAPGFKPEDLVFEEQADYEKGFAAYFDANLRPILIAENENRLACLRESKKRAWIGIPLIVILIAAGFVLDGMSHSKKPAGLRVAVFAAAAIVAWMSAPKIMYRRQSKNAILPVVANFYGFLKYSEVEPAPEEFLTRSRLVPPGDPGLRYWGDHVHGDYHGILLESWQLTTARREKKSRVVLYSGLFIHFGLKKRLEKYTLVKFRHNLFNRPLFDFSFQGLEHVALEDPEFEKMFDAYSTDQIESRYLLTPDVMQHLKELSGVFGGSPVDCCFTGQDAFLSIELKKRLFEPPPPNQSPISSKDIHVFLNQMNHLFGIIDLLNIDHR